MEMHIYYIHLLALSLSLSLSFHMKWGKRDEFHIYSQISTVFACISIELYVPCLLICLPFSVTISRNMLGRPHHTVSLVECRTWRHLHHFQRERQRGPAIPYHLKSCGFLSHLSHSLLMQRYPLWWYHCPKSSHYEVLCSLSSMANSFWGRKTKPIPYAQHRTGKLHFMFLFCLFFFGFVFFVCYCY